MRSSAASKSLSGVKARSASYACVPSAKGTPRKISAALSQGKLRIGKRKRVPQVHEKPHFNLLIDMQERMQGKGVAYQRWAKVYNLKQISETFLFMREQHIESFEDLYARTDEAVRHFNELNEADQDGRRENGGEPCASETHPELCEDTGNI